MVEGVSGGSSFHLHLNITTIPNEVIMKPVNTGTSNTLSLISEAVSIENWIKVRKFPFAFGAHSLLLSTDY